MRLCIFGAGAIGGYLAAKIAAVDHVDLSLIARGEHLRAIQGGGLRLSEGGAETVHPVRADDNGATFGVQDYVIITLKAHSLAPALDAMAPLIGPETVVVTAQNGVPWWYFHDHGGALAGTRLASVDPGGRIWQTLGPERVIGCVVYPATEAVAPGIVRHVEGDRFPVGEPSGDRTDRVVRLAEILVAAGLKAAVRSHIRNDIWVKLWGSLAFNPISALTGGTLEEIASDPDTRAVARAMMVEAQAIGESLGITFPVDVDRRIAGAKAVGPHKTSMLQDLESGRPLEIDALVAAARELGRLTETPTPTIDTVLGLVRQRARLLGLYH